MKRLLAIGFSSCVILFALAAAAAASDATDTAGLVDPESGQWYLRDSEDRTVSFYYGVPGDVAFMGDWDCDGVDGPGMYRPSTGFVYLRNTTTTGVADVAFYFGLTDDQPIAGDWDGDGCDTVGIYRPSEARVYLSNILSTRFADFIYDFGVIGDQPFAGDWDGDGIDEVGVYRRENGHAYLASGHELEPVVVEVPYGPTDDRFFAGDWDGDGFATLGRFGGNATAFHLSASNFDPASGTSEAWGLSRMQPVTGRIGLDCDARPRLCPQPAPYLREGDSGGWVADLRARLAEAGFRPGEGELYDETLEAAVMAFQKYHALPRTGVFEPYQWDILGSEVEIRELPEVPNRVEIDIGKQILYLIEDHELTAVLPISSASGEAYTSYTGNVVRSRTPEGEFSLYREEDGWYRSYLGSMYEPFFFIGGYAIHGSTSVPAYPASHGCVRVEVWDMDWLKPRLDFGTAVYVYGDRLAAPT